MDDFWANAVRFPRFLFSSVLGLIFVIIDPIRNLFKIPKLRIVVVLFILLITIFLYLTIKGMVGV